MHEIGVRSPDADVAPRNQGHDRVEEGVLEVNARRVGLVRRERHRPDAMRIADEGVVEGKGDVVWGHTAHGGRGVGRRQRDRSRGNGTGKGQQAHAGSGGQEHGCRCTCTYGGGTCGNENDRGVVATLSVLFFLKRALQVIGRRNFCVKGLSYWP